VRSVSARGWVNKGLKATLKATLSCLLDRCNTTYREKPLREMWMSKDKDKWASEQHRIMVGNPDVMYCYDELFFGRRTSGGGKGGGCVQIGAREGFLCQL